MLRRPQSSCPRRREGNSPGCGPPTRAQTLSEWLQASLIGDLRAEERCDVGWANPFQDFFGRDHSCGEQPKLHPHLCQWRCPAPPHLGYKEAAAVDCELNVGNITQVTLCGLPGLPKLFVNRWPTRFE